MDRQCTKKFLIKDFLAKVKKALRKLNIFLHRQNNSLNENSFSCAMKTLHVNFPCPYIPTL